MVMIIGGLLLSVLPGYYLTYVRIWQRETGRMGAVQRADFAIDRLQKEIRNARSVALSSDGASLTITLPARAYDYSLGRFVNALGADGTLQPGDQVQYHFLQDPDDTGSAGGAVSRQVFPAAGGENAPHVITNRIYPLLNPRGSGTGDPAPIFAYDDTLHIITITATAAEPLPSSGTFIPTRIEPKCKRCGSDLIRVPTETNIAGEIQCPQCGDDAIPTAEIVTYQSRFMVRNR